MGIWHYDTVGEGFSVGADIAQEAERRDIEHTLRVISVVASSIGVNFVEGSVCHLRGDILQYPLDERLEHNIECHRMAAR